MPENFAWVVAAFWVGVAVGIVIIYSLPSHLHLHVTVGGEPLIPEAAHICCDDCKQACSSDCLCSCHDGPPEDKRQWRR